MARPEITKTPLGKRLREARGEIDRDTWATELDISKSTIAHYERGDRVPDASFLARLFKAGVDVKWIVTGEWEAQSEPIVSSNLKIHQSSSGGIELVGLAECGINGWQKPTQRKSKTQSIVGLSEDAFVVLTYGDSLVPMGISDAMICYCDPAYDLVPGDIVYLERNDNTASLKRFEEFLTIGGHPAMSVVGWQENEEKADHSDSFTNIDLLRPGRFEEYRLDIDMTNLKRFAPVIYVRRRI